MATNPPDPAADRIGPERRSGAAPSRSRPPLSEQRPGAAPVASASVSATAGSSLLALGGGADGAAARNRIEGRSEMGSSREAASDEVDRAAVVSASSRALR